ncbi:hypothetical protein GCM10010430_77440 [Kitasatospora cystarginea]|uniref:UDP-N-acetylglucosamine kinase n=1 Tax=Kitasatospora cystarginea TaxID=58350 RepID=A0ABN3F0G9_9ACTN
MVVLVAGWPGAGKTEVADLMQAALARRGGAVRICGDLYKAAHPWYTRLLAEDSRTGRASRPPAGKRAGPGGLILRALRPLSSGDRI